MTPGGRVDPIEGQLGMLDELGRLPAAPVTVASLCSGYGGLEMALRLWLGEIDVRWHAEIDPDSARVLATHWPDVPNLGDFTRPEFWSDAERCDLIAGGIPCQPFSMAGRKLGRDDHRYLWPWMRDGIKLHQPSTVVFENVEGLTQGKLRPIFDGIVADLVSLGYDVRWMILGACAVGAAHHRHRVFLLARRTEGTPTARRVDVEKCGLKGLTAAPTPVVTDKEGARNLTAGRSVGKISSGGSTLTDFITLLPTTGARDGNGRGEGSDEYWQRRGETRVNGLPLGATVALLRTPSHRDGDQRGQGTVEHMQRRMESGHTINLGDQVQLLPDDQPDRWGKYADAIARHEGVLGRPAPEPTEIGPKGGRRLAAALSEWLMMLPEGHLTSVLDRKAALGRAGNGVVPLQAATALRLLDESFDA